jgi:uncharacterized membrane protein (UPF0127 family)
VSIGVGDHGYLHDGCSPAPVEVTHRPDGDARTLATDIEVADGLFARGLGLMFRRSIEEGYALVFPFSRVGTRGLHMVCVPFDIDALWLVDGRIEAVKRLRAWRGYGRARADTVIELPAGAADGVEPGDTVSVG